jgi:hypothetical protein
MCQTNCCENYDNNGNPINGGGTTPSPDITEVVAFNSNSDYKADGTDPQGVLYEDDYIIIGWDAPGGDVEMRIKQAGSQYECYANRNHSSSQNTLLSVVGNSYDIFATGLSGDDTLTGRLSSNTDLLAPHYEFTFQLAPGIGGSNAYLHLDIHPISTNKYY